MFRTARTLAAAVALAALLAGCGSDSPDTDATAADQATATTAKATTTTERVTTTSTTERMTTTTARRPTPDELTELLCVAIRTADVTSCVWDPATATFTVEMVDSSGGELTAVDEFKAAMVTSEAAAAWQQLPPIEMPRTWLISMAGRNWRCSDEFMTVQPTEPTGLIGHLTFIDGCAT